MPLIPDPDLIEEALAALPLTKFQPDEVVLLAGSRSEQLLFLKKGTVAVVKDGIEIARVTQRGAVLGELSVLLNQPHTADVRAVEPSQFHVASADILARDPLAWISTDWNPSNAGFGKGFRRLRISALSVIRYGELITRVHAVSFASATILGESGTPRFRCIDLRRMPASWRSQVSWFNSRLTPDMANDTAHMCLSDHYMN